MEGSAPSCPEGHGPMQLRTARRGPFPGRQFWSCPTCRRTSNATSSPPQSAEYEAAHGATPAVDPTESARVFPSAVVAAPRERGRQATFFQTVGLPEAIVEALHLSEMNPAVLRCFAQWRLDFPMPRNAGMDPSLRPVIAVAEAILRRGTTPFCSPGLEQTLRSISSFQDQGAVAIDAAVRYVGYRPTIRFLPCSFESEEERVVIGNLSEFVKREGPAWTFISQVALSSLNPAVDPNAAERGDVLLVHPEQGVVLLEVDGAQHAGHRARDLDRDRALAQVGVPTVRVSTEEVRSGHGPAIDKLYALLP